MRRCPEHIEPYLIDAREGFPGVTDDFHSYFSLRCGCGAEMFQLHKSDRDSVVAVCGRCQERIVLYDLSLYSSASKEPGSESFAAMAETHDWPARVYVGYEYGPLDDDEPFDRNDITWCEVFIERSGSLRSVFDDETA